MSAADFTRSWVSICWELCLGPIPNSAQGLLLVHARVILRDIEAEEICSARNPEDLTGKACLPLSVSLTLLVTDPISLIVIGLLRFLVLHDLFLIGPMLLRTRSFFSRLPNLLV